MSAFDAHDELSGVFRVAPPASAAEPGRASTLLGALVNSLHLLDGWLLAGSLALGTAGLWLLMGTVQGSPFLVEATQRQMAWFGVGLCGLAAMLLIDYRLIGRWAPLLYVLNLGVLAALLVLGVAAAAAAGSGAGAAAGAGELAAGAAAWARRSASPPCSPAVRSPARR